MLLFAGMNYSLARSPPPGCPANESFCLRDVRRDGEAAPAPSPCGFARRSPRSARIPTLPTDGDRTEKTKPKAPAGFHLLRQSSPGQAVLSPLFATTGRCRQSREAPWILPSRAPPRHPSETLAVGKKKSDRRNKPISVLSYTKTSQREQTTQTCEHGRAHPAER